MWDKNGKSTLTSRATASLAYRGSSVMFMCHTTESDDGKDSYVTIQRSQKLSQALGSFGNYVSS
jgi:molybdopterin-guanine dinucleotide biosynthesis protein